MIFSEEPDYYDLSAPEVIDAYQTALDERATTWAANFEEYPGGGVGEPYELGQGLDLWIDIVERWDDEFDGEAVSDQDEAQRLGVIVCEQAIAALVAKRLTHA